jgi:hypothetical protein
MKIVIITPSIKRKMIIIAKKRSKPKLYFVNAQIDVNFNENKSHMKLKWKILQIS